MTSNTTPDATPTAVNATGTLVLLAIEHKHGTNRSAHRTRQSAEAALYDHVVTWWDEEVNGRWADPTDPAPALDAVTREDAIALYFGAVEDEDYIIETIPFYED